MKEYHDMTRAELIEELTEKERLFSSAYEIVSSLEDAIIGKSLDGTITSWNRGAEKIYGYSAEEMIGQNVALLVSPDHAAEITGVLERVRLGERVEQLETERITKDGRLIHVSLKICPIFNRAGEITGAAAIARDITERKRVENELRRSERRETILNEIAHIFLTVPDEEIYGDVLGVVLNVTESKYGFFGFIAENGDLVIPSMTREIWNECLVPDKSISFPQSTWGDSVWGKAIRERSSFVSNGPFRIPEGHIPIHHFLTTPIVFGGKSIGLLAIADREGGYAEEERDLLETIANSISPILNARMQRDRQEEDRKLVEKALRESELRYREVYENSSECIFLVDVTPESRFKFAGFNPAEEKVVGYSNLEVFGKFVEEAVPAKLASQVIANYRRCVESGTAINYEEELDLPVGRRYFDTVLVPVRNAAGDIHRILGVAHDITETVQAEKELQQSNDLLKAIINAAPTAIIGLDLDGNVQMVWNPAAEKMLGWSAEEVMGRPLPCVGTESQEEFRRIREWIRTGTGLEGVEVRRQRRDGTPIDYSIYASPLHDAEGRIAGNLAVLVEITERKRMEAELRRAHDELEKRVAERTKQLEKTAEALRRSEERYALAVRGSNDGIWDVNIATGEVYFSPRWKSMLGYQDKQLPNDLEEWKKRIHPDDRNMVMQARRACLDGHVATYEIEYRLQHKDGSFRWIQARGTCLRDKEGRPTRFAGSHTDITDRKKIEDAVHKSEKKYRKLFEESKDTIFISDPAGYLVDINKAGIDLLGYTKEEFFSLDLEKLYCNAEERKLLWEQLCRYGFVSDFEVEMKRKDREEIIVHLSMTAIRDDAGQISGYQGIIHDMTERKKLERQLLQSQKMESVGILAGGVAHDFNNLLTGISGYAQILLESIPEDDDLLYDSVRNILQAADRAAELTHGLLAFSRKQLISPKPVHIDTLIANTVKLIQRIIGEDIEFSTNFSGENLVVKADPGQIQQVLMNVVTNARDAMPHGGKLCMNTREVFVVKGSEKLYDLPVPGDYALISISDTGTGIEKKILEKIFEPFYTTKEVGKGTGLGLAIVHGIVKQHNGSILASSELGKGATFDIYLPIFKGNIVNEEAKISTTDGGGMETVIVVEDDEMVRIFMKKILERAGYKVIIASDGEDAVAKFKAHSDISLVLSDVIMPKKQGREMLFEIRKMNPGIKAIFISGYSPDIIDKEGIAEEGIGFITKPFKKEDLLKKVRHVLDSDWPMRETE